MSLPELLRVKSNLYIAFVDRSMASNQSCLGDCSCRRSKLLSSLASSLTCLETVTVSELPAALMLLTGFQNMTMDAHG